MALTRRHRRKWNDPLVPIFGERLRAAMDLGGWTVTRLARRLGKGENPQTFDHLARGTGLRRCRASRRAALAGVLRVSEEWLAGEDYGLPLPGALPLLRELEGSPRVLLAVGRLFRRCSEAVMRDLEREPARPDDPNGWNATNDIHWFMAGALGHLLSPLRWRHRLVRPLKAPTSGPIQDEGIPLDLAKWFEPLDPTMWGRPREGRALAPQHEATTLALLQAWTDILQPWLDGEATLDYRQFRGLVAVLNPSVPHLYPQSWHYREPPKTVPPAGRTSPYALVDWPLEEASSRASQNPKTRRKGVKKKTRKGKAQ